MKTNELMIGSWVLINHCSGYKRVTGIDKNGEDIYTTGGVVDIGLLKPVPLTSDILEANGFKLHEDEVGMYGVTLAPYYVTDGSPRIFCDGDPFAVWFEDEVPIRYVHQLQLVLSLCGLEKEIKLED